MISNNLSPKEVFYFFEKISSIPRGSGNEKEISDYIVNFAKERNLEVYQDETFNIVIKKPATKGYENVPTIILQGHLDMVCEKNNNSTHNFLKDSLKLYIDGDFIKAKETSLGADNGIAVAISLSVLDSDNIPHPPLEVIFTAEEETGLTGATNLDTSILKGKHFINLDSEGYGTFCTSCAGGVRVDGILPIEREPALNYSSYKLMIAGLNGGHSGMEIHKEFGNANFLIGRILYELNSKFDIYLENIVGGLQDNAIPREASSIILINQNDFDEINNFLLTFERVLKNEFDNIDDNLKIIFSKHTDDLNNPFTKESAKKVLCALLNTPNGVFSMSNKLEGLVETSSNIGVIGTKDNSFIITTSVRSSIDSKKEILVTKIKSLIEFLGGKIETRGNYPGWEFNPTSNVRNLFIETFEKIHSETPNLESIHAGLECGIFVGKIENLDIISFGPDIYNIHTPEESLSISSTEKAYTLLLTALRDSKDFFNKTI